MVDQKERSLLQKKMNNQNNILWKEDSQLGIAFFCPHCKSFQCLEAKHCTICGEEVDWKKKRQYKGKVKWAENKKEISPNTSRKSEGD